MIARTWRGRTTIEDSGAYTAYVAETGIRGYRETPGNCRAWILCRADGGRVEIVTLSFWETLDAIRAFAGEDVEQAVFYPKDDEYLVNRELRVQHYEVSGVSPPAAQERSIA